MSAKGGSIPDSIGRALSSPTGWILAGGIVYLAYLTWKSSKPLLDGAVRAGAAAADIVGNVLSGQVSEVKPIKTPYQESATAVLTASIIDPPQNGHAKRPIASWSFLVTVAVNNPGAKRTVQVEVVARWSGVLWNDITKTAAVIEVPTGRTIYEVKVPVTMVGATWAGSTVEVLIDQRNTGGAIVFSVN